ncbi:MAG: archaeal flagellar protein FlaF [Methylobacteriaceae bacterium]|jgi:hypothetical protein|nr:archaeal flagellar protein FlaF [Methylobacteriaceae bacterium]
MASLYAQTSGTHSTNSTSYVPIPGLSFQLPEGVGAMAIVTLNVPYPYATGNNYPGGMFALTVNGKQLAPVAGFSYSVQNGNNRIPTTLVIGVPLTMTKQVVAAVWQNVRGSTVMMDSPATLSAIY